MTPSQKASTSADKGFNRQAWWLIILGIAILLTLKYFPGLENETAYSGLAFKAIYPDAFANDLYRGGRSYFDHPLQLTIFFVPISIIGDLWLDDRFLAVVYLCIVVASLVGIDKTARLFGLNAVPGRVFLLFLFAKDHAVLSHKVLVAHHADVNHTAFAIPLIIWLFYAALARKGLVIVIAISIVLALLSVRNASFPVAMALVVVAVNGHTWERRTIIGMFIAGAVGLLAMVMFVFPTDEANRLELWDLIKSQEEQDANPFQRPGSWTHFALVNSIWVAIIGSAIWFSKPDNAAFRGLRIICGLSFLTLLIGGAYITFAPDFMKVPMLIGFAPTRALAWPQNLAYIGLVAIIFQSLEEKQTRSRIIVATCGFFALFIIGPGDPYRWGALIAIAAIFIVVADWFYTKRIFSRTPDTYFAASMAVAIIVGTLFSISNRADDWQTAFKTGVFGGNPSAEWIGVAEYFRDQTPQDISILPFAGDQHKLRATRSLATRSGRAITVPEVYGPDFRDPKVWHRDFYQLDLMERIGDAMLNGQTQIADQLLPEVYPKPDYLVIPKIVYDSWPQKLSTFANVATKGQYMILKKP